MQVAKPENGNVTASIEKYKNFDVKADTNRFQINLRIDLKLCETTSVAFTISK